MKHVISLTLVALLAACGGGGSAEAPTSAPVVPACSPKTVTIQISGDSTNYGETRNDPGSAPYRVAAYPELIIQQAMDQKFGAGAVKVTTTAIPGATAADLLAGRSDMFAGLSFQKWPAGTEGVDIVLMDFGANEALGGVSPEVFKANLRALAAARRVVFQTPLPNAGAAGLAQSVREVANETGMPLIDLSAWALALPSWPQYLGDGLHPMNDGYALITRQATVPALVPLVEAARCAK